VAGEVDRVRPGRRVRPAHRHRRRARDTGGLPDLDVRRRVGADGAHPQRPLWASTGTKNPAYKDTIYVEELIAPGTVNTMPEAVINAFADHGETRGDTVTSAYAQAQKVMDDIAAVGVDLPDVFKVLEDEGVEKFEASWGELLEDVKKSLDAAAKGHDSPSDAAKG